MAIDKFTRIDISVTQSLRMKQNELELAKNELETQINEKARLTAEILEISALWEVSLTQIVNTISESFRKAITGMARDGEVVLVKLEKFKEWKLDIRAKFLDATEMTTLGPLWSGGQKAAAILCFMISLGEITPMPMGIIDGLTTSLDSYNRQLALQKFVGKTDDERRSQKVVTCAGLHDDFDSYEDSTVYIAVASSYSILED